MKSLIRTSSLLLLIAFVFAAGTAAQRAPLPLPPPPPVRNAPPAATQAAASWMNLLDEGQYDQAWQDASRVFQERIGKDYWRSLMAGRSVYGEVLTRKVTTSYVLPRLPGFPNGTYFAIRYEVAFSSHETAPETVVLALNNDTWFVVDYDRVSQPMTTGRLLSE